MPDQLQIEAACTVCECPCRREIDILLLQGFLPDEIVELLPEAPRRPAEVKAHQFAGHVDTDWQALIAIAIQVAQDVRKNELQLNKQLKPEGNDWWMKPSLRKGADPLPLFRAGVNFRMRYIEMLGKLVSAMEKRDAERLAASKKPGDTYITQNVLNIAEATDPGIVDRIAKARLEKQGYELRRKKKTDAA